MEKNQDWKINSYLESVCRGVNSVRLGTELRPHSLFFLQGNSPVIILNVEEKVLYLWSGIYDDLSNHFRIPFWEVESDEIRKMMVKYLKEYCGLVIPGEIKLSRSYLSRYNEEYRENYQDFV